MKVIQMTETSIKVLFEQINEQNKRIKKLKKENEELKEFVRKISTNGRVVLANGNVYKIDKVVE